MQIANMGGLAVAIDLRLEGSAGRIPDMSILLLLDREADRFLAKRVDADAELVKPVDPGTLASHRRPITGSGTGIDRRMEMQRSRARTGGTASGIDRRLASLVPFGM